MPSVFPYLQKPDFGLYYTHQFSTIATTIEQFLIVIFSPADKIGKLYAWMLMTFEKLSNLAASDNAPRLCTDSRLVKPGDIFVAVKGANFDGHNFIPQAISNGAKYIVHQQYLAPRFTGGSPDKISSISVADSSIALALLAQAANGNPASKLTNLAVTGTNGKTTVAFLVRSCIQAAGQKCGLIGTVVYDTGDAASQATLTTPDSLFIAQKQKQMLKAGANYMVIEASSHALDQNRLAAIDFKAAAFTNLTGDHMDYHKTKEEYLAAKSRLFAALSPDATAVLNKQSPESKHIAGQTKANVLWYAIDDKADITAHIESMDIEGTVFTLQYAGEKQKVRSSLLGRHNVSNHLAAAGLCLAAGLDLKIVAAGLSSLKTVPGRLEKVPFSGDFAVLVDYAHTDDALKNVLSTLKPLCKGNLIVVFGCGGDRDRTKRPRMAAVVEQLADIVIVTSDNPRTEQPMDIISEIVSGFKNKPALRDTSYKSRITKVVEPDRRKAIKLAIRNAGKDDIILLAGKGHENYQIIGKEKFPFSDQEIAADYLAKKYGG
jgi:UDP-N-acetylmuramoyl-L-alanyl-D-glutamate--2,6-diaminopimelate ligase